MTALRNDLLMRALRCQAVPRRPLWLMRQAGRYLPEYRLLRAQAADFMSFCKQPKLACQATLQPIERFGLDAAIIFSDILTIPDALGCGVGFVAGKGPKLKRPVATAKAIAALPSLDMSSACDYVYAALQQSKQALAGEVPLIGFSGSPWTLACYMIEGAGSRDFISARRLLQHDASAMHALLEHLTQHIIDYLQAQIAAGADVLMLFDSWGGLLGPYDYRDFSLSYMQRIIQSIKQSHPDTPVILFSKGVAAFAMRAMAETGAAGLGIDWAVDLQAICKAHAPYASTVALQGNLDPACLFANDRQIKQRVHAILQATAHLPGFIFNLGHGINKDTPLPAVETLVQAVKSYHLDAVVAEDG